MKTIQKHRANIANLMCLTDTGHRALSEQVLNEKCMCKSIAARDG